MKLAIDNLDLEFEKASLTILAKGIDSGSGN